MKKLDYSDRLSVFCEIDKVEKRLGEKQSLEALSIAKNLITNRDDIEEVQEVYKKALENAKKEMQAFILEKNWKKVQVFFDSIKICEPAFSTEEIKNINKLLQEEQLKGNMAQIAKSEKHPYACTIEEMIDATVTVFVDKGLKVEKGLGYSDIILGSGFFIDEAGYFITNYHVIQSEVDPKYEGYSRLYIKNFNGSKDKIPAKVVGYDPLLDLALVKTQAKPSHILKLGSSENLKIGSKIYAIGSPLGLERTITSGIVSSKNRQLLSLADVIQIDAAINHGSSGGPIVDEKGEVQAVVFAGVTRTQGLNFAIPIELLKNILPKLYAGGESSHTWLACFGKDVDELDEFSYSDGVVVSYVMPLGAMGRAGGVEDCVITKFNDVKVQNLNHLKTLILALNDGSIVKLNYKIKNGDEWEQKECYPLLEKRPQLPAVGIYKVDTLQRCLLPFFGIKLEYTGSRRYFRVKKVIPRSYGDEAGFLPNDYLEIRNMSVSEQSGVIEALLYVKKLKTAYIESFMGVASYGDNAGYF